MKRVLQKGKVLSLAECSPCEGEMTSRSPDTDVATVFREVAQTLLLALVLALLIRGFLIETYLVYGPSMEKSLFEGERLLVNKLVYRFRDPIPGEIVVFREPGNDARNLVKRVVAVAGQTLEVRSGDLFVDGQMIQENYVAYPSNDTLPTHHIPDDTVFVMGDNRPNSLDSRYFGPVPSANIRGRAFIIFWPPVRFSFVGSPYR